MSNRKRMAMTWVAIYLAGFCAQAHAYLDPGTGSILIQGLLAGIAGAVAIVTLYWRRVKSFFLNLRRPSRGAKAGASTDESGDS